MLSKSQVQHVAKLAKLKISDQEAEQYAGELSRILGYIDQLKEIATDGRALDIDASGLLNRWRTDAVQAWPADEKQLALQQADLTEKNLIKVPKII